MEPIPETQQALDRLSRDGSNDAVAAVHAMAQTVQQVAPSCVGLSIALFEHDLTFTLAASSLDLAALDGVQYLDGGPCVTSAHEAPDTETNAVGLLDERRWQLFAQSSAAAGVRSSLTLPLLDQQGAGVLGSLNLYGATPDAFEGCAGLIAGAVGGSATQAVHNADLDFTTRLAAAQAPDRMDAQRDVDLALGVIMQTQRVDLDTADERLHLSAARAGVTDLQLARALLGLLQERES